MPFIRFYYRRPHERNEGLSGGHALQSILEMWTEGAFNSPLLGGYTGKTGFLFLYELLTGEVSLDLIGDGGKFKRELAAAHTKAIGDEAPQTQLLAMATALASVLKKLNMEYDPQQCVVLLKMMGLDVQKVATFCGSHNKSVTMAAIDSYTKKFSPRPARQGRRCSNATLGKLLTQLMFLKAIDNDLTNLRRPSRSLQPDLPVFSLLLVLSRAAMRDAGKSLACAPEKLNVNRFPRFPYEDLRATLLSDSGVLIAKDLPHSVKKANEFAEHFASSAQTFWSDQKVYDDLQIGQQIKHSMFSKKMKHPRWAFVDDRQKFVAYSKANSDLIERAMQANRTRVEITCEVNGKPLKYEVLLGADGGRFIQRNIKTQFTRKLMRMDRPPKPKAEFRLEKDFVADQLELVTDLSCGECQVLSVTPDSFSIAAIADSTRDCDLSALQVTGQDIEVFATVPLVCTVDPGAQFSWGNGSVVQADRIARTDTLPFNVSHHALAQTECGARILQNMADDIAEYARKFSSSGQTFPKPQLKALNKTMLQQLTRAGELVSNAGSGNSVFGNEASAMLQRGLHQLVDILDMLRTQKAQDMRLITAGIAALERVVNTPSAPSTASDATVKPASTIVRTEISTTDSAKRGEGDSIVFEMMQKAGQNRMLQFPDLVSLLNSSAFQADIRRINPFLSESDAEAVRHATCGLMFRTVRVAQIKRCIGMAQQLRQLIETFLEKAVWVHWEQQTNSSVSQDMVRRALFVCAFHGDNAGKQLQVMGGQVVALCREFASGDASADNSFFTVRAVVMAYHICDMDAGKTSELLRSVTATETSGDSVSTRVHTWCANIELMSDRRLRFQGEVVPAITSKFVEYVRNQLALSSGNAPPSPPRLRRQASAWADRAVLHALVHNLKHKASSLAAELVNKRPYTSPRFLNRANTAARVSDEAHDGKVGQ